MSEKALPASFITSALKTLTQLKAQAAHTQAWNQSGTTLCGDVWAEYYCISVADGHRGRWRKAVTLLSTQPANLSSKLWSCDGCSYMLNEQ